MPRLPFRITLFLSSFAPLFLLMAIANRNVNLVPVALATLSLVGVAGLFLVLIALKHEPGPRFQVKRVSPKDGEVLSYVAAYLLPFLAVDLTKADNVVLFTGFLIVLCVVYINSDMLFINPLLNIAGYHAFEVTDMNDRILTVVTRQIEIDEGSYMRPAQVDRYIRVDASWRRVTHNGKGAASIR